MFGTRHVTDQMGHTKVRIANHCACSTCRAHPRSILATEHRAINRVLASLDEKGRRRFVGLLASQRGWGGVELVSEITGVSRPTIRRGRREIRQIERKDARGRIRRAGAGRPAVEKKFPES